MPKCPSAHFCDDAKVDPGDPDRNLLRFSRHSIHQTDRSDGIDETLDPLPRKSVPLYFAPEGVHKLPNRSTLKADLT